MNYLAPVEVNKNNEARIWDRMYNDEKKTEKKSDEKHQESVSNTSRF